MSFHMSVSLRYMLMRWSEHIIQSFSVMKDKKDLTQEMGKILLAYMGMEVIRFYTDQRLRGIDFIQRYSLAWIREMSTYWHIIFSAL